MIVKEYNDVLVLARGVIQETMKQTADGFQMKDLIPIVSENMDKALAAFAGSELIKNEFKEHLDECIHVTLDFIIDAACDLMKIPEGGAVDFKETGEILAAVNGLAASVIKYLPGGIQSAEIMPILLENFQSIVVGADGAGKVVAEMKGDIRLFFKTVLHSAVDLTFRIKAAVESTKT
jgi:hypothetical protein